MANSRHLSYVSEQCNFNHVYCKKLQSVHENFIRSDVFANQIMREADGQFGRVSAIPLSSVGVNAMYCC
jgi:hypothetical protein